MSSDAELWHQWLQGAKQEELATIYTQLLERNRILDEQCFELLRKERAPLALKEHAILPPMLEILDPERETYLHYRMPAYAQEPQLGEISIDDLPEELGTTLMKAPDEVFKELVEPQSPMTKEDLIE